MPRRVFVVASPPEGEMIASWLGETGAEVRVGDGSDDTLAILEVAPAEVIVLSVGLATGDSLSFANAVWQLGSQAQLVLIADESGTVRTALDAMEFRADRFLQRPLSRSALVFAVKSCLSVAELGRAGVAQAAAVPRRPDGRRAITAAFAALRDIVPEKVAVEVSSGVVKHTLATKIEEATAEAVDAFLADAVEHVLGAVVEEPEVDDEVEEPTAPRPLGSIADLPQAEEEEPAPERESTLVLSGVALAAASASVPSAPRALTGAPQPPDDARTGTFVSALRKHMSALEEKLFGGVAAGEGGDEASPVREDTGEIDLDAIGVTTLSSSPDDEIVRTDIEDVVMAPVAPAPSTGRTPAPTMPGSLGEEDVATLLGRLARERVSGRVVLRQGAGPRDVERTLFLEDGRPVFASSSAVADRMGDQLVRESKITRDQLARARDILVASGRRMGEILVELGSLKRRELLPAVRRHIEELVYSVFAWDSGTFSVGVGTARDEKIRLASPAATLIVEGIRRKIGLERLRLLVGPDGTVLLPLRREDGQDPLVEAELTAKERQAVELFDGRRTVAEVAAAGPGEPVAWLVAHALLALGLASRQPREATDAGRVTTGVSYAGSGSISGVADVAIDRDRVLAKHHHVREADYFELLGVRRDATAFEIGRAFEAARRDYAPEGFPQEVQRELAGELSEIASVLVEAHRVLRNDDVRVAYLKHLVDFRE